MTEVAVMKEKQQYKSLLLENSRAPNTCDIHFKLTRPNEIIRNPTIEKMQKDVNTFIEKVKWQWEERKEEYDRHILELEKKLLKKDDERMYEHKSKSSIELEKSAQINE